MSPRQKTPGGSDGSCETGVRHLLAENESVRRMGYRTTVTTVEIQTRMGAIGWKISIKRSGVV